MQYTVGLKELRENMEQYTKKIQKGLTFIVLKRSKPIFKIGPVDDEWEEVADFTKIKKGGVDIEDVLSRL
ncbi:MAG: hypothetical protein CMI52_04345 [Parcubacteria group bacterium]|nr:hypothetical protein [Parcubacteria group bacterium]|tara:strand:+ start:250 stop:459 length:210 start_codon:yes stop_codon:yes gene_type:complete